MTAWLQDLSARLKAALIAYNDREQAVLDAIARARADARRQAGKDIAREIRSVAPRPHQAGECGGPASCVTCGTSAQAWRLAEVAELTGAGQ